MELMRDLIFFLLGLLSFAVIGRAEEYEIVRLSKGQTISGLLFERGETGLYGPRGKVQRTLDLNQLTLKKSRNLPPDFPVKLIVEKKTEKPEVQIEEVKEIPVSLAPVPINSPSLLHIDLGYLSYVGKSDKEGKFSANGSFISLSGQKTLSEGKIPVILRPSLQFIAIPDLDPDTFINYGVDLFTGGNFQSIGWESAIHVKRLFYIYGKDEGPKTMTITVPGISLFLRKNWENYFAGTGGGLNFGSQGSAVSPFGRLFLGKKLNDTLSVEAESEYQRREFRSFTQNYITIGIGVTKSF